MLLRYLLKNKYKEVKIKRKKEEKEDTYIEINNLDIR